MRHYYKRVNAPAVLKDLKASLEQYHVISQDVENVLKQIYEKTGFPEDVATLASEISNLKDVSFLKK